MIAYVRGICLAQTEGRVVVESGGIGYAIQTGKTSSTELVGQEVSYYTFLNVREDAIELYGFESLQDKALFMQLTTVSGIGPKSALGILSATDAQSLAYAIVHSDEDFLRTLPGVGKKTAGRMILELKDKLVADEAWIPPTKAQPSLSATTSSVLEALSALGYEERELRDVQGEVLDKHADVPEDELLRRALAYLRRT